MNKLNLKTQCACIVDDTAWIFSNEYNAMYTWRLDSHNVEYVCSFDKEPLLANSLFTKMIPYGHKLFLIPCVAETLSHDLVIYDCLDGTIEYLPMEYEECAVYFNPVAKGANVLIFPVVYSKKAYLLDMEKVVITNIDLDYGEYDDSFKAVKGPLFCGFVWQDDEAIYGIYGTRDILKFNVRNHVLTVEKNVSSNRLYLMNNQDNRLYGLDINGERLIGFDDGYEYSNITLPYRKKGDVFKNGNGMAYPQNVPLKNCGWLMIPVRGNDVLYIDNLGNIDTIPVDWEKVECAQDEQPVATVQEYNGDVYAFPYQGDYIWKINVIAKKIDYIPCMCDGEILENLTIKNWSKSLRRMVNEKEMDLRIYMSVISYWKPNDNEKESLVGNEIYRNLI